MSRRPILITGGAGFIGCNLADRLASSGVDVIVLDSLCRPGVEANLAWLRARHGGRVQPLIGDVCEQAVVAEAIAGAAAVFHFAAQVAVTTSLAEPARDFEVNLRGTLNVLEAARAGSPPPPVIFASTNKVYGAMDQVALEAGEEGYAPTDPVLRAHGVDEQAPLCFHSPYGCSKGGADQYVLDFARSFGLPGCVLRMSCIYGPRQMGTEDQGWVAHFLIRALEGRPITLFGDGRQVRDILFIDDAVSAYVSVLRRIDAVAGRAFNLGGGPENAVSLKRLLAFMTERLDLPARVRREGWRVGDQRWYVSDTRAARAALALPSPLPWRDGVRRLADWLTAERAGAGKLYHAPAEALS